MTSLNLLKCMWARAKSFLRQALSLELPAEPVIRVPDPQYGALKPFWSNLLSTLAKAYSRRRVFLAWKYKSWLAGSSDRKKVRMACAVSQWQAGGKVNQIEWETSVARQMDELKHILPLEDQSLLHSGQLFFYGWKEVPDDVWATGIMTWAKYVQPKYNSEGQSLYVAQEVIWVFIPTMETRVTTTWLRCSERFNLNLDSIPPENKIPFSQLTPKAERRLLLLGMQAIVKQIKQSAEEEAK